MFVFIELTPFPFGCWRALRSSKRAVLTTGSKKVVNYGFCSIVSCFSYLAARCAAGRRNSNGCPGDVSRGFRLRHFSPLGGLTLADSSVLHHRRHLKDGRARRRVCRWPILEGQLGFFFGVDQVAVGRFVGGDHLFGQLGGDVVVVRKLHRVRRESLWLCG